MVPFVTAIVDASGSSLDQAKRFHGTPECQKTRTTLYEKRVGLAIVFYIIFEIWVVPIQSGHKNLLVRVAIGKAMEFGYHPCGLISSNFIVDEFCDLMRVNFSCNSSTIFKHD